MTIHIEVQGGWESRVSTHQGAHTHPVVQGGLLIGISVPVSEISLNLCQLLYFFNHEFVESVKMLVVKYISLI